MSGYTTKKLEAAVRTLGFSHISPESLTRLREDWAELDHETRREYREFMWDMGRMMRDPDESQEDRQWRLICYVRDKMEDVISAMMSTPPDLMAINHIALDVKRRTGEV